MLCGCGLHADSNIYKQSCWWTLNRRQLHVVTIAHSIYGQLTQMVKLWVMYHYWYPEMNEHHLQIPGLR